MFESLSSSSIISKLLVQTLGDYIEGFDPDSVHLSFWDGCIQLENLTIKKSALDYFDVPFSVAQGSIRKIEIRVPWTTLLTDSSPIKVIIEDVCIVLQPHKCTEYDPSREEEINYHVKKLRLDHHERYQTMKDSWNLEDEEKLDRDQPWSSKLGEVIFANMEFSLKNLHVRYEDLSNRKFPMCFGLSLPKLKVTPQGAQFDSSYARNISFENLIIYSDFTYEQELVTLENRSTQPSLPPDETLATMDRILEKETYRYLIEPFHGTADMEWQKNRTKPDLDRPLLTSNIQLQKLKLVMDSRQWDVALGLSEYFSNFERADRYRKNRPTCTFKTKEERTKWWKHTIKCLKKEIKGKRFTWDQVEKRKIERNEYIPLYKKRIAESWTAPLHMISNAQLETLQKEINYQDIILYREIAKKEMNVLTTQNKSYMWNKEDEKELEKSKKSKSWYDNWFGKDADDDDQQQIEQTRDRSQQSNDKSPIKYDNNQDSDDDQEPSYYPDHYDLMVIGATCTQIVFETHDYNRDLIGIVQWDNINTLTRFQEKTVHADASLHDFRVINAYYHKSSFQNIILRSDQNDHGNVNSKPLFSIRVQTHPNGSSSRHDGDLTIDMNVQPMDIVINVVFIQRYLGFFAVPSSVNLKQLQQMIKRQVNYVGERAADKLKQALQDEWLFTLQWNFIKPRIILLEDYNSKETQCLILSADQINLNSINNQRDQNDNQQQQQRKQLQEEDYYTHLTMDMKQIELYSCHSDLYHHSFSNDTAHSKHEIFQPFHMQSKLGLCLLVHTTEFSVAKLESNIDVISILITPEKMKRLVKAFNQIVDLVDYPIGYESRHVVMSSRLILVNGPTLHRMTMDPDNDQMPDSGRGKSENLDSKSQIESGFIYEQQPQQMEYWAELHDGGKLLLYDRLDHERVAAVANIDLIHGGPKCQNKRYRFGLSHRLEMMRRKRKSKKMDGDDECGESDFRQETNAHICKEETHQSELRDDQFKIALPARNGVQTYFIFQVPSRESDLEVKTRRTQLAHEQYDVWRYGFVDDPKNNQIEIGHIDQTPDPVEIQRKSDRESNDDSNHEEQKNHELISEWCRRIHCQCLVHALYKMQSPSMDLQDESDECADAKNMNQNRVIFDILLQLNRVEVKMGYHQSNRTLQKNKSWYQEDPFMNLIVDRLVVGFIYRAYDFTLRTKMSGVDLVDQTVANSPVVVTTHRHDLVNRSSFDQYDDQIVTMEMVYLLDEESLFYTDEIDIRVDLNCKRLFFFIDAITCASFAEMWHDLKDVFQELIGRTAFFVTDQGISGPQELLTSDRMTVKSTIRFNQSIIYLIDMSTPCIRLDIDDLSIGYGYNGRTFDYELKIKNVQMELTDRSQCVLYKEIDHDDHDQLLVDLKYTQHVADSGERNSDNWHHDPNAYKESDGITISPYWINDIYFHSNGLRIVALRQVYETIYRWIFKSPLYQSMMEADMRDPNYYTSPQVPGSQLYKCNVEIRDVKVHVPTCTDDDLRDDGLWFAFDLFELQSKNDKKCRTMVREHHLGNVRNFKWVMDHMNVMEPLQFITNLDRKVRLAVRDVDRRGNKLTEAQLRDFLSRQEGDEFAQDDFSIGAIDLNLDLTKIKIKLNPNQFDTLMKCWRSNLADSKFEPMELESISDQMIEKQKLVELQNIYESRKSAHHLEHGTTTLLQYVSMTASMSRNWTTTGKLFKSPEELTKHNSNQHDDHHDETNHQRSALMCIRMDSDENHIHDLVLEMKFKFVIESIEINIDPFDLNVRGALILLNQSAETARQPDQQEVLEHRTESMDRIVSKTCSRMTIGNLKIMDGDLEIVTSSGNLLDGELSITQNHSESKLNVSDLNVNLNIESLKNVHYKFGLPPHHLSSRINILPNSALNYIGDDLNLDQNVTLSHSNPWIINSNKNTITIDGRGHVIELSPNCIQIQSNTIVQFKNTSFFYQGELNQMINDVNKVSAPMIDGALQMFNDEFQIKRFKIKSSILKSIEILQMRIRYEQSGDASDDEHDDDSEDGENEKNGEISNHNVKNVKRHDDHEKYLIDQSKLIPRPMCVQFKCTISSISLCMSSSTPCYRSLSLRINSPALSLETNQFGREHYEFDAPRIYILNDLNSNVMSNVDLNVKISTMQHEPSDDMVNRIVSMHLSPIRIQFYFNDLKLIFRILQQLELVNNQESILDQDQEASLDIETNEQDVDDEEEMDTTSAFEMSVRKRRCEKQFDLRNARDEHSQILISRYLILEHVPFDFEFIIDDDHFESNGVVTPILKCEISHLEISNSEYISKQFKASDEYNVSNYSTFVMKSNASLKLTVEYFNTKLGEWEPILEPCLFKVTFDSLPIQSQLQIKSTKNWFTGNSTDVVTVPQSHRVTMNNDGLEFTCSKLIILNASNVFTRWQSDFDQPITKRFNKPKPFEIRNCSGCLVEYTYDGQLVTCEDYQSCPLPNQPSVVTIAINSASYQINPRRIGVYSVMVDQQIRAAIEAQVINSVHVITIRSLFKITNRSSQPISIGACLDRDQVYNIGEIQPDQDANVPIQYASASLRVMFDKHSEWSPMSQPLPDLLHNINTIQSINLENVQSIYLCPQPDNLSIEIKDSLSIRNLMFCDMNVSVVQIYNGDEITPLVRNLDLKIGQIHVLTNVNLSLDVILFINSMDQIPWSNPVGSVIRSVSSTEDSQLQVMHHDSKFNLSLSYSNHVANGPVKQVSVYSPYWIVDHTHQDLNISDQTVNSYRDLIKMKFKNHHHHQIHAVNNNTVMSQHVIPFQFENSKHEKIKFKLNESDWSDSFDLDHLKNNQKDVIKCNNGNVRFDLGIHRKDGDGDLKLTKIITITSLYILTNQTQNIITAHHINDHHQIAQQWTLSPNQCIDLYHDQFMIKSDSIRLQFSTNDGYKSIGSVLSDVVSKRRHKMTNGSEFQQFTIESKYQWGAIVISISNIDDSIPPYYIKNELNHHSIQLSQKGLDANRKWIVPPHSEFEYTWDDESSNHLLILSAQDGSNRIEIDPNQEFDGVNWIISNGSIHAVISCHPCGDLVDSNALVQIIISDLNDPIIMNQDLTGVDDLMVNASFKSPSLIDSSDVLFNFMFDGLRVGLSLIDSDLNREIANLNVNHVELNYQSKSDESSCFEFMIHELQMDTFVKNCYFPVLLQSKQDAFLHLIMNRIKQSDPNVQKFKILQLMLNEFNISVDTYFMEYAYGLYQDYLDAQPKDYSQIVKDSIRSTESVILTKQVDQEDQTTLYHFERMYLSDIQTFASLRFDRDASPEGLLPDNIIISAFNKVRLTVDDAPIQLNHFMMNDTQITWGELMKRLQNYYLGDLKDQLLKIASSVRVGKGDHHQPMTFGKHRKLSLRRLRRRSVNHDDKVDQARRYREQRPLGDDGLIIKYDQSGSKLN
ncbi:VPS13 [Acrasis kona]|uniref:VPS13 n=1 Tax=Acrasis kona TaxID=1008807 RepID=A0AAW2YW06_9EUKA